MRGYFAFLPWRTCPPARSIMPSCSQPSRTLRVAGAVARRRAILDRHCARRQIARAGRDGRMVPIEQKDWTEEDGALKPSQNYPLDSTNRQNRFGSWRCQKNTLRHLTTGRLMGVTVTPGISTTRSLSDIPSTSAVEAPTTLSRPIIATSTACPSERLTTIETAPACGR
jgi:hypothetical protein